MRSGSGNLHTISRQFSYNFAKSWLFAQFLQRSLKAEGIIKSGFHQCLKKVEFNLGSHLEFPFCDICPKIAPFYLLWCCLRGRYSKREQKANNLARAS